ncbi:dual specificity testis-specific protein kinase 2-like [Haliotis rubra]|uniref:dual specificity testis-specific protein kinase 2-like n=1 Tax=Haliotis rubra TaxID=36100 RepID=UPI001EE60AA7|nr:dual specificity testis-specific protein kinase 2-like [Haliotis rubra]
MASESKRPPSTKRQVLRRSRTCVVSAAHRNSLNFEPKAFEQTVEKSRENSPEKRSPQSTCQALKHAVSALTRLDDFVSEKLGFGFFSDVYKVTHRMTGQVMVLKMNKQESNRANVLREVQLMNRLAHPNILRFLGVCVHEGQLHALTEFINGGNLEQLLARWEEELPWTQRISLALDMARGVNYLHSRGFFHRDLTSKNVLLRKHDNGRYTALIADFGLSVKIPDPLNDYQRLPVVGSPFWMAPEALNGLYYNERADVFSYGIILCEITARVDSDPDNLPRTKVSGVDYVAFSEKVIYCPLDFLQFAFKCCQIEANKRPSFPEIVESMEKIQRNLNNELLSQKEREKKERKKCCKRSKSEDNILQANDSSSDIENMEESYLTPRLIGQVMSRDDPYYQPSQSNPFASHKRYKDGHKLLGTSRDAASTYDLPSPTYPFTPPCTPQTPGSSRPRAMCGRNCHSLPSSPVLLRKAAERLHMESLHGSAKWNSTQINTRTRSKSAILSESVAMKLQYEWNDGPDPISESSDESDTFHSECAIESQSSHTDSSQQSSTAARRHRMFSGRQQSLDSSILSSYTKTSGLLAVGHKPQPQHSSRDFSPTPSVRSSCESFMSIDEQFVSPASSLSSYSETND